jgi:hypothetical protein
VLSQHCALALFEAVEVLSVAETARKFNLEKQEQDRKHAEELELMRKGVCFDTEIDLLHPP